MACNGLTFGRPCGNGNNSCMWTLIIIAIIVVWLNCGCSLNGNGEF